MSKKKSSVVLNLVQSKPDCKKCSGWKICFADGEDEVCVSAIKGLLQERGPYAAGEIIYHRGDRFRSIYIVQSGVVKTETETLDGRLNVTGFYLSGEIFGLEGIGSGFFPGRSIASRETRICEISYDGLLEICKDNPALQREFIMKLGQRIQADEYEWKMIRNEPASTRLLYFLCDLCHRQTRTTGECREAELPMNKQDIANFLGLSPESFSRALKKLEADGSIKKLTHDCISINKNHLTGTF